ncbi:MAG: hypothetical protein R2710_23090 [Acidimicrobiales bacterium]
MTTSPSNQRREPECRRQFPCPLQLGTVHRPRGVDQQAQGEVVLGVEQLDEEAVEPGEGADVDTP